MTVEIEHNYTKTGFVKFITDGAECFWNFWIRGRTLKVELIGKYNQILGREEYSRKEYWTDEKKEKLHEYGFRKCEGLHDNIAWWGVPVLMRLYNLRTVEITDPDFSRDTPQTLNDRMSNNLVARFAKSLARATVIGGMDMGKVILMGVIGIGAFIGMKMFGVF